MPPTRLTALAALMILATTGCSTRYRFSVDAIRESPPGPVRQSYRLDDARPAPETADDAFPRVAADIDTALSAKGLYPAPEGVVPDLVVEVDFGMSAPIEVQRFRTEPIVAVVPPGLNSRLPGDSGPGTPGAALQNLGTREVAYVETITMKFLRLTARHPTDGRGGAPRRQVWSVHVTNEDASRDLAHHARLMVAAAMDFVDQDHPAQRDVVLTRKDPRVSFVARGLGSG